MAMKSFVANGQAYFYYEGEDGKIYLKLGRYSGVSQKKDIAELRRSSDYPSEIRGKTVILKVCGSELTISEMTDLELFLKLEMEFDTQLLW